MIVKVAMKARFVLLGALLLVLPACGDMSSPMAEDQCMRHQLFQECLKSVPAGPLATKYNDWDEVVQSCENAAYYQSLRLRTQIKPECLAER